MARSQLLPFYSFDEVLSPIIAAYESALALDPLQSEALALNPDHQLALANLINSYGDAKRFVEGQRLLEQLPPAKLSPARTRLQVGLFYAARGDRQKALEIYRDLAAELPTHGMLLIAELAMKVWKVEEAFGLMEREVEINSFNQFWARPVFRNEPAVQNHPRFLALLEHIGIDTK